ncbi:MAG: hypothetical protein J6P73_07600 [Bacteroidales bacterium]|nr:hypothetical protein [Bacteroidales bacterium]
MVEKIEVNSVRIARQNSMNMLRQIVAMVGKGAEITVLSYSVTDGWLRQLMKLKDEMQIAKVTIILDRDVMIRHRQLLNQLESVANDIYLSDSHAKAYLAIGKQYEVAVITSANATQNYRNECFYTTDRPAELERLKADVGEILRQAFRVR